MTTWRILVGDVRERLADIPAGSVQTCVTSPPYWGLRDYGHAGQLGLEATPAEYVRHMVDVFASMSSPSVWRALREDGTLWLNLGDSYANDMKWGGSSGGKHVEALHGQSAGLGRGKRNTGLKPKDLVGIPWMVAFALRDAGWYLRSEIIWAKPNPMPESVTDRPTKSHEYIFLLTKKPNYFFDAEAIAEDSALLTSTSGYHKQKRYSSAHQTSRPGGANRVDYGDLSDRSGILTGRVTCAYCNGTGEAYDPPDTTNAVCQGCGGSGTINKTTRNKRSVWTVATQPYPEAHFATYPEDLITPCILSGTSEKGQCQSCGAPWGRVVERTPTHDDRPRPTERRRPAHGWGGLNETGSHTQTGVASVTTGWQPTCACDAGDPVPQIVLDPFTGSGTTGAVAIRHQRSFVGCELNQEYVALARRRIGNVAPMFATEIVS